MIIFPSTSFSDVQECAKETDNCHANATCNEIY